ncbi:MAG: RNA polymerase sigma factor [Bacteroidetes bacterium QS_8_64_10]|nr:MAG: RNA polymerase sigma factor [Bacteroidetes bacterium QS_8_64_10]
MGLLDWLRRRDDATSPPFQTNEEWLEALRPPRNEDALEELRAVLVRGLEATLRKRIDRDVEPLAEDFAQDALLRILDRMDSFRGESKFTTWAQKVAVNLAFSRLRRKRWENVSLADLTAPDRDAQDSAPAFADPTHGPDEQTSDQMLLARVERIIEEQLTEKQRTALNAVMQDMPLQEVARRMDTNRNALYKLIHDARKNLKSELEKQDLSSDDLLAELERG